MTVKQVCVIGAGISGLVSAKTFLEEGYEVTVFEKHKGIGGVWEKSRIYPGVTTQTPRDMYAFSDYPMPAFYPESPTGEQVRNYLESYAQHFGIAQRICFQAEVTNIARKTGEGTGWIVTVKNHNNDQGKAKEEKHEFDFVLICNGTCNIPNTPSFPGKPEFMKSGGLVLHSTDINDDSLIQGKRVVVIGFAKSAADIATFAADKASECTLVFRQASWKIPRYFLGFINIKYLMLTRLGQVWFPYRKLRGVERLLHTVGKPLVWAFWRTLEMVLRLQLRLDACGMLPEEPIEGFINCPLSITTKNFYKYVRQGKIRAKKTTIERFVPGGVELANGERLSTDVIILGTGFQQNIPFLQEQYRQQIIDKQGNFHLYRNLIHPHVPNMGFVGYNSIFSCTLSSEIGSRWLVEYVKGNLVLPSCLEMLKDIEEELEWRQTKAPRGLYSATCFFPFSFHYLDYLMRDMGASIRQTGSISELMKPLSPSAYKNLRQELQAKRPISVNYFHPVLSLLENNH
ncbi:MULTISPECIES: flavin-containing monooxygenase [unclassified Tolypothrix]|uniref:flavin-containing monooxygenase n=1 Tax=unclassified Tolypothrix TaxID=2649714 RepID=UPI0005EABC77|nr:MULTISPECIES: NAD(P)-binding domain-containing protein [unclassified Tolypothrix]BAY93170.1 dimethylaniline monooxygenase [Microchaete diplosiphon NIES-3275]EKF00437.1 flavin-binding monooxygenase-like protein [Tolypothrix sp. PCC 7601]MBE9085801.1 NAD(P)-binding domain-containing protein [Tolypothrix sp. LEGE 11397]UYD27046.1 NAD(P)-binding domain-containing protein [Tolypothrix sp. PCC 7712]UYD37096.1 NAD(P)-binding domain-containing protein [Tolypothrix sp. PCC 7601]